MENDLKQAVELLLRQWRKRGLQILRMAKCMVDPKVGSETEN